MASTLDEFRDGERVLGLQDLPQLQEPVAICVKHTVQEIYLWTPHLPATGTTLRRASYHFVCLPSVLQARLAKRTAR